QADRCCRAAESDQHELAIDAGSALDDEAELAVAQQWQGRGAQLRQAKQVVAGQGARGAIALHDGARHVWHQWRWRVIEKPTFVGVNADADGTWITCNAGASRHCGCMAIAVPQAGADGEVLALE